MVAEGQSIHGKYRLERHLGSGGFASVWAARIIALDRPVALKILSDNLACNTETVKRFVREARLSARAIHPTIVQVEDIGQTEQGVPFLVMELLHGRTLQDALLERDEMPLAEALSIVRPVLEGLAAAHSLGVIHRDVKPGNIFLVEGASAAPRVKILDLGLAKNLDASEMLTRSGLVMGTPDYLAPELLSCDQKHAWSPAADVFAVGVVAYVLLTGRRPLEGFVAPDSSALGFVKRSAFYREHAYDARWAPDVSGRVPAAIADVVFRALAIGRERRYADAGEMLRAFDEACARGGFGVEGDGLVVRSDAMEAASAATVPARDWSAPGADAQRLEAELRAPAAASTIVLHPPPPLLRQAAPHRLGPVPGPALSPFAEAPPSEPPTDHRRTAWLAAGLLLLLLLLLAVGLIAIASWLFG